MKHTLFLSLLLISLGASILIYSSFRKYFVNFNFYQKEIPAQLQTTQTQILQKPAKIYFPTLETKILNITDGTIVDKNRWEISETGVSYLTTSALPGQGNTVLYGHDKRAILGSLPYINAGDPIYVVLAGGDFIKYTVYETKVIKPTEIEILNQTLESKLTIYTCNGFLDQSRFVAFAKSAI